jgi:hypothetical protein
LRNLALVDSYSPEVKQGDDSPLAETYCSIVGETQRGFMTEDTRRDEAGDPFGSLCHFDLVPCDVPVAEMPLMEAAAPPLMDAMRELGLAGSRCNHLPPRGDDH